MTEIFEYFDGVDNDESLWNINFKRGRIISFILTIGFIVIAILWGYKIIFPDLDLDFIFDYLYIYLFGIQMHSVLSIIYIFSVASLIRQLVESVSGLIGDTIRFLFYLLLYCLILQPFGTFRVNILADNLSLKVSLNISFIIILLLTYQAINYVLDLWTYPNLLKSIFNKKGTITDIEPSIEGEYLEPIKVIRNSERGLKTYHPNEVVKAETDLIYFDGVYYDAVITQGFKNKTIPKRSDLDDRVIYEFSDSK